MHDGRDRECLHVEKAFINQNSILALPTTVVVQVSEFGSLNLVLTAAVSS